MAEPTQYLFKHQETVTALIKQQGLHEGIWQLAVQFSFSAANISSSEPEGVLALNPAVICPVIAIGLTKAIETTNLTVDAAVVNPAPKRKK